MNDHVLVVEHDEQLRGAICMFLKRAGLGVHSTATADAALERLLDFPALIVLDLALPDKSGMRLLNAVRDIGMPTSVALITSGWDVTHQAAINKGCADAIFGKPFDFQDFADWLDEVFGETQSTGGMAAHRIGKARDSLLTAWGVKTNPDEPSVARYNLQSNHFRRSPAISGAQQHAFPC